MPLEVLFAKSSLAPLSSLGSRILSRSSRSSSMTFVSFLPSPSRRTDPLCSQMAMLVEAQDIQIMQVEANGEMVAQDMEKGMLETKKAVVSARGSRKKRWWCFGILMVILVRFLSFLSSLVDPAEEGIADLRSCHRRCPSYPAHDQKERSRSRSRSQSQRCFLQVRRRHRRQNDCCEDVGGCDGRQCARGGPDHWPQHSFNPHYALLHEWAWERRVRRAYGEGEEEGRTLWGALTRLGLRICGFLGFLLPRVAS